jgi:hypothetical protein
MWYTMLWIIQTSNLCSLDVTTSGVRTGVQSFGYAPWLRALTVKSRSLILRYVVECALNLGIMLIIRTARRVKCLAVTGSQ